MAEGSNALSRNPNVCASCSSLSDGMYDETQERATIRRSAAPPRRESAAQPVPAPAEVVLEWTGASLCRKA